MAPLSKDAEEEWVDSPTVWEKILSELQRARIAVENAQSVFGDVDGKVGMGWQQRARDMPCRAVPTSRPACCRR